MYAKIQKEFNFMAAVHFNGKYMVNFYEMNAVMAIISLEEEDQNTAIERVSYFIGHCLEDCIFVCDKEKDAIDKYTKAGMKVCTIPEEPYDQIVGLVILNKCNSIMEGRITMTDIVFGSKLSNMIKFELNDEVAEAQFDGTNWWNSPTMCIQNVKKTKKEKIVNLFDHKVDDWAELELTWTSK
jgi:hypothetical protein